MSELAKRRMILVHAHPDDETITTGSTMAGYAADGAAITLVTCTRGEQGQVQVPALAHHAAEADDTLGDYRSLELANAMKELGITDHIFLGAPTKKYRDSGMMGTPPNQNPDCFWNADLIEASLELVAIIRDRKPQVLVTYDENGGYGHPDHIKAHQVAMKAAELASDPQFGEGEPWDIEKIYWTAIPRSAVHGSLRSSNPFVRLYLKLFKYIPPTLMSMSFVKPDDIVTTEYDGEKFLGNKLASLRAHATQVILDGDIFHISKQMSIKVSGREFFTCVKGSAALDLEKVIGNGGPEHKASSSKNLRESDLFAGVNQ